MYCYVTIIEFVSARPFSFVRVQCLSEVLAFHEHVRDVARDPHQQEHSCSVRQLVKVKNL